MRRIRGACGRFLGGELVAGEIIIVPDEPSTDEATIPVDDAVDLVESAIDHVTDAIADAVSSDDAHDDNMAFVAGVTVAALDALTGRMEVVETRLDAVEAHTAAVAEVVEEVAEAVAETPEIVEEPEPEPDEPPDTLRRKINRAWFGSSDRG